MWPLNVVSAADDFGYFLTMTSADGPSNRTGYVLGDYGSINTDGFIFDDWELEEFRSQSTDNFRIQSVLNQPDDDSVWKSVEITGNFGAGTVVVEYIRANRDSYQGSGRWEFNTSPVFIAGNNYILRFLR